MNAESPLFSFASLYLSVLVMKGNYSGAQPGIIYRKMYYVLIDTHHLSHYESSILINRCMPE